MKEENAEVNTFEPAGNRGHASDAATFRRNNKERFWGVNMKQKLFGFLNLILMLAATTATIGAASVRRPPLLLAACVHQ